MGCIYMRETKRIVQMFEYYYTLGEDRKLQAVADNFNISLTSVRKYSKQFNWDGRIEERDSQVLRELRDRNNEELVDNLDLYRKVIKASVADYIKRLKDKKVKVESVKDFVKLVELEMKVCGFRSQILEEKMEATGISLSAASQDTLSKLCAALEEKFGVDESDIGENNKEGGTESVGGGSNE